MRHIAPVVGTKINLFLELYNLIKEVQVCVLIIENFKDPFGLHQCLFWVKQDVQ
jgi:hypothetical protein